MPKTIDQYDPKDYIVIKGARVNNLKNLDVAIPRDKLVVITGLSGSGKSSLAFDTLFAEGQRKYVESLSSYARQFLGRMEKPEVDYIKGVAPAIAIEQKVSTRNPRSTVGTTTEIYDYMKLLFARVGITYSPVSGEPVKKDSVTDVVDFILSHEEGTKLMISAPLQITKGRSVEEELKILLSKGYTRVMIDGETGFIEDLLEQKLTKKHQFEILIDRAVVKNDEDTQFRLSDSVQTAFFEGEGHCKVTMVGHETREFSDLFELDGIRFEEPSVNFFSFNNPYGACRRCEGFGRILGIDPEMVIPDPNLSVYEGAIAPWRSETMSRWLDPLLKNGIRFDFPIHRPVNELTQEEYQLLWTGNEYFEGLDAFFQHLEAKTHKIQFRVMLSRYRGRTACPDCRGTRLRKDASYVKIADRSIADLVLMPVDQLSRFFETIELSAHQQKVAKRILNEITNRLNYLEQVGLGYLTLNRLTNTLSGGEFQRIKLATSLGSALVGSMYILDEPSIGLHPRDTDRLIEVLVHLRNLGNSVIVVEHEEKVMEAADEIIDIGPAAGVHGGELVYQGRVDQLNGDSNSFTARYIKGTEEIALPKNRRKWNQSFKIEGARENNLKNIDVEIPLGVLTVITGVSGSGKSTLVKKILYPGIGKMLGVAGEATGKHDKISGDYKKITQIEFVDQNPIGKSSRSNPVTYVKAYDGIRQLFSEQPMSKNNGFKPAHFSFNVDGGRCEVCEGEGTVTVEMQFMADLHLECENCRGKRFKKEILEVKYQDKDISEILDLTVEEAIDFFADKPGIVNKIKPLYDVGLGYVKLGQSSNSLSGGEAQRVKLASFLGKGGSHKKDHVLFIFDEPTTGLHFHDIKKLLDALNALVNQANSVLIIEHNMEIVKNADWIIDLGPEGGDGGGELCFAGLPEEMAKLENNHTAKYLKEKIL
ncbi:excinuclease ABC subunit UvrA [Marinoscillum furvescens]|uniref:UvrABC system protein A n=1 Tax=Marinoscillum furvescens DSM 4134 TaxID=1122208 RepID=A0A3D9L4K8_MARFU|nr:excinuclease ABC subunit UvrA [Marinoscillum furvescens]RED98946.1 excinuclease ABC subunit A [Marinoscillum furvescens DSM 4134]